MIDPKAVNATHLNIPKKCFGHWFKTRTGYQEMGGQDFDSCVKAHNVYGSRNTAR